MEISSKSGVSSVRLAHGSHISQYLVTPQLVHLVTRQLVPIDLLPQSRFGQAKLSAMSFPTVSEKTECRLNESSHGLNSCWHPGSIAANGGGKRNS
jgi:hypothetical protein